MESGVIKFSLLFLIGSFLYLQVIGDDGIHKSLHKFEIRPYPITEFGVSNKKSGRLIMGKTTSSHFLDCFDRTFFILAGNGNMHKV